MSYYSILFIAAVTAFFFRFSPVLLRKLPALSDPGSPTYKFLSYSSQAMLGLLTFQLIFGKINIGDFLDAVSMTDFLGFLILVVAFALVARTGYVAAIFITGSTLYGVIFLTFG